MDRQEHNRQFCAFSGKQEAQRDGVALDHDGEFQEPRGQFAVVKRRNMAVRRLSTVPRI